MWDRDLCFFNNKEYGPYLGGTVELLDRKEDIDRFFSERRAFGPTLGVYYRYFRVPGSGAVIWTLTVSLLYPIIIFAALPVIRFRKLPAVWLRKWRRDITARTHRSSGGVPGTSYGDGIRNSARSFRR